MPKTGLLCAKKFTFLTNDQEKEKNLCLCTLTFAKRRADPIIYSGYTQSSIFP